MISTMLSTILTYIIVISIGIGLLAGSIYFIWWGIKESDSQDYFYLALIALGSLGILLSVILFLKVIGA